MNTSSTLWAVAVLVAAQATTSALAAHSTERVQRRPIEGPGELLALAGGRLLVWDERGGARLRSSDGTWRDRAQLPFEHVWQVVPDGEGFLASGSGRGDVLLVLLFGAHGDEVRRWRPSEVGWGLVVQGTRRWYVEPAGLVELLPDGRLGPIEPVPDSPAARRGRQPDVFQYDGRRLVCYSADLSMEHNAPASCREAHNTGWILGRAQAGELFSCGRWVIARVGRDQKSLAVWTFDGAAAGRRSYPASPVFACSESDTLVIGAGGVVQLAKLPALTPQWTHRVGRGSVVQVAAPKGAVAYGTDKSSDVVVVAR